MKLIAKGLFISFISFIWGSTAVLAQQTPDWYNTGKLSGYSSPQYITGVAAGPSPEAANDNASKEIAEQIRVNIESTTQLVQKEVVHNDESVFNEMFKSAVTSTVNETISGIEIAEQEKVGDTYYAFAALDKDKYLASLRGRLDNQLTSIQTLLDEAQRFTDNGKL
jgi:hypothetical protein